MAGEIQLNSTTFATESGGTVTVSNVDNATNRQNLGLEIGVDVQSYDADTTKNDVANTFTANQIISVTDNTNAALRVTQLGTGNALVVEDSTNPDSSPFVVDSSGNVGIGTDSPSSFNEAGLPLVIGSGSGNNGASIYSGSADFGSLYFADGTSGNALYAGYIAYNHSTNTMAFGTGSSEAMRIDSSGNVVWGNNGSVPADSDSVNAKVIHASDGYVLRSHRSVTTAINHIYFFNPNGLCGKIETSGTTTLYVTSSDYRLKENITEITDGITRVKQLNPSRFNFIADPDKTVDGFIAHEVQGIVPEAVSGEKDAVNEDGSINPQGIDQSKLVPLLTAALQESIALIESQQSQIDALTARIEALETT